MSEKRSTIKTKKEAMEWFRDFVEKEKRMPPRREVKRLHGPSERLYIKLGGSTKIALELGFNGADLPKAPGHDPEVLTKSLREWLIRNNHTEAMPTYDKITAAFQAGDAIMAPGRMYSEYFGSWKNALTSTGLFKFEWQPSECIGFAARAKMQYPDLKIRYAMRAAANIGKTPLEQDVVEHYPNLRPVVSHRLSWAEWHRRDGHTRSKRNTICVLSHGVLALASAEGDMTQFADSVEMLHKEDRGPEFSRELFASVNPNTRTTSAGYVWALDTIERAYVARIDGTQDIVNIPGIGSMAAQLAVHPVFAPELRELKAA